MSAVLKHTSREKALLALSILIAVLAAWACIQGIYTTTPTGPGEYVSLYGETVKLKASGLYFRDSVSVASQGIAQDKFTLFLAIPLLLLSSLLAWRGLLKGKLIQTGMIAYFLYTYMSYSFLSQFNSQFLNYVALFGLSLYGFIFSALEVDREVVKKAYRKSFPIKLVGGFQIFIGIMLTLLWVSRIGTASITAPPTGLEHYTTLPIQAMDLALIVPTAIFSGVLLFKRSSWGYWLSTVVIFKGSAMLLALTAMMVNMYFDQVVMSPIEIVVFLSFTALSLICLGFVLFCLDEPEKF